MCLGKWMKGSWFVNLKDVFLYHLSAPSKREENKVTTVKSWEMGSHFRIRQNKWKVKLNWPFLFLKHYILKVCREKLEHRLICKLINYNSHSGFIYFHKELTYSNKQFLIIKFNALSFMFIMLYKDMPINISKISLSLFWDIL